MNEKKKLPAIHHKCENHLVVSCFQLWMWTKFGVKNHLICPRHIYAISYLIICSWFGLMCVHTEYHMIFSRTSTWINVKLHQTSKPQSRVYLFTYQNTNVAELESHFGPKLGIPLNFCSKFNFAHGFVRSFTCKFQWRAMKRLLSLNRLKFALSVLQLVNWEQFLFGFFGKVSVHCALLFC